MGDAPGTGGLGVEVARPRPRAFSRRSDAVAALFDDLAVDDLLCVRPGDPAGVFEARHHLVESRRGAAHTVARQLAAKVFAGSFTREERAEDDELQMRECGQLPGL